MRLFFLIDCSPASIKYWRPFFDDWTNLARPSSIMSLSAFALRNLTMLSNKRKKNNNKQQTNISNQKKKHSIINHNQWSILPASGVFNQRGAWLSSLSSGSGSVLKIIINISIILMRSLNFLLLINLFNTIYNLAETSSCRAAVNAPTCSA